MAKGAPPKDSGTWYVNAERRDRGELTLLGEYVLIARGHLAPRPWSRAEIAILMGCTRQNVDHIEASALAVLREHMTVKELAS